MRTYLLLKERAAAFRADPEVQEALEAAQVAELSVPTLNEGESYDDFLADRSAYEDFDTDVVPRRQGLRLRAPAAARHRAPARRPLTPADAQRRSRPTSHRRECASDAYAAAPRSERTMDDTRRGRRLVDAVLQGRHPDAATGAVVRTGRAAHPDGTEVDPGRLVGRAARRDRGCRAASTTCRDLDRRPAARHGGARCRGPRHPPRAALERHPLGAAPPPT